MPEVVESKQPELPLSQRRFEIPADPVVEKPAVEVKEVKAVEKKEAEPVATTEQDAGKQATPSEPEAKPEEKDTPDQAAKRDTRRFERKIDKAYKQRAEALAKADLLEKRLAELESSKPTQKVEGEPTLAQFDYDPEKYAQAKADYAKQQAVKEYETKQKTEAQTKAQQALVSVWEDKADKGSEKYDDWDTVVGTLQPVAPFIAALMEADNGEEIAYHLGKNPSEATRISRLPPLSQVREIGKLEAKFLSEPVKPKAPSKAPAPIAPLAASSTPASDVPSEDDDIKDWMKKRSKQVHGSGRR